MSLTNYEETRIINIETALQDLQTLASGAASEEMLNRLLTLANQEIKQLSNKIDDLEDKIDVLINLARRI